METPLKIAELGHPSSSTWTTPKCVDWDFCWKSENESEVSVIRSCERGHTTRTRESGALTGVEVACRKSMTVAYAVDPAPWVSNRDRYAYTQVDVRTKRRSEELWEVSFFIYLFRSNGTVHMIIKFYHFVLICLWILRLKSGSLSILLSL